MIYGEVIDHHPFFGAVTTEEWHVVLEFPGGPPGVECVVRGPHPLPAAEGYAAMGARLHAFEHFCRSLGEHDPIARRHFGVWPASAGAFQLVGIAAAACGDLPVAPEDALVASPRPFSLNYRALDEDVWECAGDARAEPVFAVFFAEDGGFLGIEAAVDRGMRALPAVLPAASPAETWNHPYFGRHRSSGHRRVATGRVGGRGIEVNLILDEETMFAFDPKRLDSFASLVERMGELDRVVRAGIPEELRDTWLYDSFDEANDYLHPALRRVFPDAAGPEDVGPDAFAAAMQLKGAFISLEGPGSDKLVIDYCILPGLEDDVIAAAFSPDGTLLNVVYEG